MKDQLTVGELRKSLEGVPDDVIVGIDTEGGAFTIKKKESPLL